MASSVLDAHLSVILLWIQEGLGHQEMAERFTQLGVTTSEASIRRCIDRNASLKEAWETRIAENTVNRMKERGADREDIEETEDEQTITSFVVTNKPLSVEDMLRIYKVDTEKWEVRDWKLNSWPGPIGDGRVTRYFQTTVFLKKKVPLSLILPASEPLARTFVTPKPKKQDRPILTMVETDPQLPFIIEPLNELALRFIEDVKPDRHVTGGDLMNLGYIGRHRDNPAWDDTTQESIQSAFDWLYYRRSILPEMEMHLIPGNHDDRIRNEQLERNERLYGISQARYPNEPDQPRVYSLGHLLRLDELGIIYNEPKGTYEFEYVELTPILAVRHGHKLNSSKTAPINTAMDLGHSVILGHSHSQSAVAKTVWNKLQNTWEVRWALEAGCECVLDEGLGFNKAGAPDWQPGFVTITSWPNGQFTFDFAQYTQDGSLYWRDKKYTY